jgi:23S rRNA maturation-related 3'-5' exoribonuclease YhaM
MENVHKFSKYIELCNKRKKQVTKLLTYLDGCGLQQAPASSVYHLNKEGGLVEHSINVCETLLKLREVIAPDVSVESCVITALFHDCHKVCDPFGNSCYLPNMIKGKTKDEPLVISSKKPYVKNDRILPIIGAYQSVIIVSKFVNLTPEEMQAIALHDGQYVYANKEFAQKEFPLTLLLHYADMWSCRVLETLSQHYEIEEG